MNARSHNIEKLSLYYWRNGKFVSHSSRRDLLVVLLCLRRGYNVSRREVRSVAELLGSSDVRQIDRKVLGRYLARERQHIRCIDTPLLETRYSRLAYSLWCRGYEMSSLLRFERSLRKFEYFSRLTDLGYNDLRRLERLIHKKPLHYDVRKRIRREGWLHLH